jgi:hypothetical protein
MISAMMVAMQARTRKRTSKPSRLMVFLPLVAAFAIIAGIAVYGVLSPSKATPRPNAPGFRGSLVWGDGIFSNKAQLRAWLVLHGASYQEWVRQHPAALRLVKPPVRHRSAVVHKTRTVAKPKVVHRTAAPATPKKAASAAPKKAASAAPKKAATAAPKTAAPATPRTAAPVATTISPDSTRRLVIWVAVIAGLLFGVFAVLPRRFIRRAGLLRAFGERELRLGALGAGAAVLLGVIVATLV